MSGLPARLGRSPVFWILLVAALLRLTGLSWGLPASDGWDDDGVAPRNFLVGVVQTYAPGSYFAYPPLHMILLMVLTLPGWIIALLHAHSLAPHDVIASFIGVPYMTFFAVVARLVSVAMSLGTIFVIGQMTETIAGRRAGFCAATACALNAMLTYYGQVTNLDGPYLFWVVLALREWIAVIAGRDVGRIRWAMFFAAAATATKDQAYAVFLLSIPAILAAWFVADAWPRRHARTLLPRLVLWAGVALLALAVVDGAITNYSGFLKRVAFLAGPASQDYAQYEAGFRGWWALSEDMWAYFPRSYPAVAGGLAVIGILLHIGRFRGDRPAFVAGLLPLFAAVSFTLAFNFVALRSENRFLLPQSVLLAVYMGIAADRLTRSANRWFARGSTVLILSIAGVALFRCLAIDAAFIGDPRYDAERWMVANIRPSDTIEALGLNVYLPRFPRDAVVTRLDRKPLSRRNPLPNVTEIEERFDSVATRNPRFIVVNAFWLRDYLMLEPVSADDGRIVQQTRQSIFRETAARKYFSALLDGKLGYRIARVSAYIPNFWPDLEGYESLTQTIFVLERIDGEPGPSAGPS